MAAFGGLSSQMATGFNNQTISSHGSSSATIDYMKVASNPVYGDPSVIQIVEKPKPTISSKQILVRVEYSSVTRTDIGFLRAKPFVTRFFTGLRRPKYISLGSEFSGVVDLVGSEVLQFKPGDKVFGFDDQHFGGHAEYKAIKEDAMVVKVPEGVSMQHAAVALEGAHYALFYIYAFPKNQKQLKVFVNGATGAIGSAAVQIIAAMGHHVEASAPTKHMKLAKKLGASKVIDWQTENISEKASQCDVYFDSVGKSSYAEARKILAKGGVYMSSELGKYGQNPLLSIINPIQRLVTNTNIAFPIPKTRKQEALTVARYLQSGQFVPLLDKTFDMQSIREAYEYVETGQKIGNVRIKIRR